MFSFTYNKFINFSGYFPLFQVFQQNASQKKKKKRIEQDHEAPEIAIIAHSA